MMIAWPICSSGGCHTCNYIRLYNVV
jgi:hypothetical protein